VAVPLKILKSIDQMFRAYGMIPEIPQNVRHWLWMHNICTVPFKAALSRHGDFGCLIVLGELYYPRKEEWSQ
jgi:hypothetical protein